jgi:hypothetical protein
MRKKENGDGSKRRKLDRCSVDRERRQEGESFHLFMQRVSEGELLSQDDIERLIESSWDCCGPKLLGAET